MTQKTKSELELNTVTTLFHGIYWGGSGCLRGNRLLYPQVLTRLTPAFVLKDHSWRAQGTELKPGWMHERQAPDLLYYFLVPRIYSNEQKVLKAILESSNQLD